MILARIYLRVSTEAQDLTRQESIVEEAKKQGYKIACVYREKASGASMNRPELQRMINDLDDGEVVIAEKIDRISRLPLAEAKKLIEAIKAKGAKLVVPGIIDLSQISSETDGVAKVVIDALQDMLLNIALQMANDEYETRRVRQKEGIELAKLDGRYKGKKPNKKNNERIIQLRNDGISISQTAKELNCSISQVKKVYAKFIQGLKL